MSKKKGFRTVVATVIVTLVVLAALSYATLKYIAPAYQLNQNKIYQVAVKVFPLILGITLIAIASVLAGGKDDEEDEDDKLPPNAYDSTLFDEPKDDPTAKDVDSGSAQDNEPTETGKQEEAPFVSVFETYSDEDGSSKNVEPQEEVTTEGASEPEEKPAEEPVETEAVEEPASEAEEKAVEEQPNEDANKPLIDAIKALSDKIDDFAAAVVYGTEDSEEDDEEYYDGEEEEDPIYEGLDRIEVQLEKLTQAISQMADNLHGNIVVAPQPVAPVESAQPEEAEVEEEPNAVEETKEEGTIEPAKPVEHVQPIAVSKDNTGSMLYRNYEGSEARQKAMAEYDSAKEFGYDLTVALVDLSLSQVALALGEIGDFVDVEGKTLVIIPFSNEDEAKAELDKLEATYKSSTYTAGSDISFEELASGIVE